ncbi:MAG: hypothetical protein ACJ74J_11675 [Blastocatellia bacterium]
MKRKIIIIALAVLGGAAILAIGLWRAHVAGKSKSAYFVIVRDLSDSVLSGCDCTAALVKRAFADPHAGNGSTVTVTGTGDASSAGEPKLVMSVPVPATRNALEDRDAAGKLREKVIGDIKAECEKLKQTKVSPIFIAIKRAVEHLRASGCGKETGCTVYVQSDLEETGDSQIKAALNRTGTDKPPLPEPINNDGIRIIFCGIAETSGEATSSDGRKRALTPVHNPQRADRIRAVWSALFTNPERLTFEPYCGAK